ncbi:MAG: hypothetical protein NTU89_00755, partial [Candidatus Dependentiae bacterium]|nr:hypothetical protein [Candidatus Dependentiae bacterium]
KPKDIGKILRIMNDFSSDAVKMELGLKNYMQSLGLKDPQGKPFVGKDFNPFVKSCVKSTQECDEKNPAAIFAQGTTRGILLGYLLIKSNDRKDLQDYFEGFLNKSVTLPEEQYPAEQLKGFADQTPDLQEAESFADFVCGTVYEQIYASPLPKIITSNTGVDFQGIGFTDCMECVMRNLCNIATYDTKNKIFGAAPKESSLSSSLKIFYEAHSSVTDVAAKPAHQAWVNVVENVEGVAYNKLCTNSSTSYASLPSDCEGFIPMESVHTTLPSRLISVGGKNVTVYEKQVGSAKYLLVPKSSDNFCCELMPSTRNVIVLMNQSLNLNLYPNQEATFEPGFENKYLEPMSQKFGWSVDSQSKDLTKGVNLKVSTKSKHGFEIKLSYKAHGSVNIIENQKKSSQLEVSFEKGLPAQQAIATSLGLFDDKTNAKNDYYCDLQDPNRRVDKIVKIMQRDTIAGKMVAENLMTSIGFLQDEHYLSAVYEMAPETFSKEIKNTVFLRYLKSKSVSGIIQCVKRYKNPVLSKADIIFIINHSIKLRFIFSALCLASAAIEKGVLGSSDKADIISWINDGLKSSDSDKQARALELAHAAIANGVLGSSDKADIISWINDGLKSSDSGKQARALYLAEDATKKGVLGSLDKADIISWINDGLKSSDRYVPKRALHLVYAAIEKGVLGSSDKAYIIPIINSGIKSSNPDVVHETEQIKALVQNKYPGMHLLSILDRAKNILGVGGFRSTPLNLMRKTFDQQMKEQFPEASTESFANQTSQNRFVQPSSEELSAQRNQMQRFNSGYDSSLHTGQAAENTLEQQRLVREQATQRLMNQQRLIDQKTFDVSRLAAGALKVDGGKMKQLARSAIK